MEQISTTETKPKRYSLEHFILKYGEEEGIRKRQHWLDALSKAGRIKKDLQWYISKYGEEDGTRRYNQVKKNLSAGVKGKQTLPWYISKYGEEDGTRRYNENIANISKSSPRRIQTIIDRYGIEYYRKIQRENSCADLQANINKYGEERGLQIYNARNEKTAYGHSLAGYIEKHGKEQGYIKWKTRQEKWQRTLKSKSPEEIANINKRKFPGQYEYNRAKGLYSSGPEELLAKELQCEQQLECMGFWYDLYKGKKVIEFQGDYWHCNPKIYKADFLHPAFQITAKEIWKRDKIKAKVLKQNGYDLLIVWEDEFKKNQDKVIEQCKKFLNETN
jgi:hypothetical protein